MKGIFLIENSKLAELEIKYLLKPKIIKQEKNIIILETNQTKKIQRMAFTKKAYEIKNITNLETYKIEKITKNITTKDIEATAKKLKKEHPESKVNLTNPKTIIGITKELQAIKIYEREKLINRRADKRPAGQKAGINPKLARLMINLLNPKDEIYDPFAGTGGLLIEAGLMGLKTKGTEIDKKTADKALKNFKFYNINSDFKNEDALKTNIISKYIVTDPPYGRSTSNKTSIKLLIKKVIEKNNPKRIVLTMPKGTKLDLPKKAIIQEREFIYVHKSLTRELLVISFED